MKKILSKLLGGALLFGLTMSLTSCEDILGHWEKPTPNPITPGGGTPVTPEEIYAFTLCNMADADITATAFNVTDQDGNTIVTAESDGKYTIKSGELSSVTTLWLEATTATGKYIAKATKEELPAIAEAGKLKMATLGDMILDDGTFAASSSAGTKVAMIAYVGSDACEAGDAPYNHGLALALSDASTNTTWCDQTAEACLVSQKNSEAEAQGDMAGIANTDYLIDHAGSHIHSAATAARQFKYVSTADAGAHPTGTTKWFLPSAGQWKKMIDAYGLTNLKTTAGDYNGMSGTSTYYLSTENTASLAWGFRFSDGYWLMIGKNIDRKVRSCLAF